MMVSFMIGAFLVAATVAVAAAAAERAVMPFRHVGLRWVWATALVVATGVPALRVFYSPEPSLVRMRSSVASTVSADAASRAWPEVRQLVAQGGDVVVRLLPMTADDHAVAIVWLVASAMLAVILLASVVRLHRDASRWEVIMLEATAVRISDGFGPALLGLWRPVIVLPPWVRSLDVPAIRTILAHERAHRDAGDLWLLATAGALVIAMPWNLPLWWMRHRMRRAVELDCDLRVVRANGMRSVSYASFLLAVGEQVHAGRRTALAASLWDRASELRHRISRLVTPAEPSLRRWIAAFAALVVCGVVIAMIPSPQTDKRLWAGTAMPASTAPFASRIMRISPRLRYFSGYDPIDPALLERIARVDSAVADEVRRSDGSAQDRARIQRLRRHLMDVVRAALDSAFAYSVGPSKPSQIDR